VRGVYLIHFSEAYEHAGHYIGYADDIQRRIVIHRKGNGPTLTRVAVTAGRELIVAQVWQGRFRRYERKLKNLKGANRFCRICNPTYSGKYRGERFEENYETDSERDF
jgi:predicted GIY-YIG superfamily endonuclease